MIKKISVVINTYNRCKDLEQLLESLYYLEYKNFEVIVVNGPSTDNTNVVLEKYKNDIKIASTDQINLSVSRNIGIAMSAGDYVAFIDDDAIPDRLWLNKLLKGFNEPDVAGVGGDTFDITGVNYQARRIISFRNSSSLDCYTGNNPIHIPHAFKFISTMGVNSIYSKACLLKINGYDEQCDYYLDQTDLCARLIDAGYYINYQEGADVYHKFIPSHLRDKNHCIKNYTTIIKNIYYYLHQYKPFFSDDYIEKEFFKAYNHFLNDNYCLYKDNKITKEEYIKAKDSIEEGIKEGKKSVARGYKLLMTKETLTKYKSDYKQFPNFFQSDLSKKRTIVFLANFYEKNQHGTSTLAYNLAYNMAKKGHNIHIITVLDYLKSPTVTYEEGIWVHRFPLNSYSYDFLRSKTPYDIDMVENTNYIDLFRCYTVYDELLKLSNKYKIDIIQEFTWGSLNFYLLGNENFTSITCLVTPLTYHFKNLVTGEKNINKYQTMTSNLEEYCILNNNNIISDSVSIKYLCKDYFNYQGEPELIYLGLEDLSKEKFENNLVKDNSKIEILFLARLEYRKGIDLLYAVIPAICEKYPNVIFRIVGVNNIPSHIDNSKTYTEIFLQENEHLVQKGQVIIEGKVKDKLPYYQNCDIFISPSRYESFGFTVVEAMIFSKPTIGNNAGAIPEVIEDNVTGLLFEKDNTDSLKNAIIKLIENKDLREKMGIAGRKIYEKLFTAKLMAENYLNYYEKVLNNKKETE